MLSTRVKHTNRIHWFPFSTYIQAFKKAGEVYQPLGHMLGQASENKKKCLFIPTIHLLASTFVLPGPGKKKLWQMRQQCLFSKVLQDSRNPSWRMWNVYSQAHATVSNLSRRCTCAELCTRKPTMCSIAICSYLMVRY